MSGPTSPATTDHDKLEALLGLAFESGPAWDANALIHTVRARQTAEHGRAVSYEISLLEDVASAELSAFDSAWHYLCELVAPRLRAYLGSHGYGPRGGPGAFVSLFYDDKLHFLTARDFLAFVASEPSRAKYPALLGSEPELPVWVRKVDNEE